MRTILLWLLPLYNLFVAIALLRRAAFRDADSDPRAPSGTIVALCWSLTAVAVADFFVLRDARFVAVPYVLFAINAFADWRLVPKMRATRVGAMDPVGGNTSAP